MRRDEAYLLDMLIAARKARNFVHGISIEEFQRDEKGQSAAVHQLEIVGEAASRISSSTKDTHPEISWGKIVAMRNRLVHEYFQIDIFVVWNTILDDLPDLIAQLEPLVPPE